MDSKGPKHYKMHCYPIYEDSEDSTQIEKKHPQTDEADDFFALVHRIQALNRLIKKKTMNSSSAGNVGATVTNGKSPWKPVFQLEDFFNLPSTGSPRAHRDMTCCTNKNTGRCGVSAQEDIGSEKYMAVEVFDLNVEPTPEFC
ncbi:hypothetical protein SUGI_0465400 [Cryptomeria japonica]|uniref:uncharacterized protein LOC131875595 n=1 Tax=Cryptomeria japonica TaxID=3369 RepID=UPI002408E1EB|nr:uncharacterized protein LOC131875595 [Cryptomeria japonica]GLJ24377.1 hypothetical protein SUGI_0465400 [Cryptomeria japonica]